MDREQQPFDWGFGAANPSPDDSAPAPRTPQPVSQWPQQELDPFPASTAAVERTTRADRPARSDRREERGPRHDEGVSYDPLDLGFEEQEVPRRSLAARIAGPVITLLILGGLVGGGLYAGDGFAKSAVTGVIQDKIGDTLELDAAATERIDVDLGGGFFIGQAAAGTIDEVTIDVPSATFGTLAGRLGIDARAVPVNPTQPTGTLGVTLALDEESSTTFAAALRPGAAVTLGEGTISIASTLATTAILVAFEPSAVDGALVLTPQTITVSETPMTLEEFAASRYATAGAALMEPQVVCIAPYLPAALTLTDLGVTPTGVQIAASGKSVSISRGLSSFGACE